MVAYSFKRRFVSPIEFGSKTQTIRADRKRHARVGEELQLYTAMRTQHCRLIGRAICVGVGEVRLDFMLRRVDLWTGVTLSAADDLEAYALRDGFASFSDMAAFWRAEHGHDSVFSGIQIEWGQNFEPAWRARLARLQDLNAA